VCVCAIEYRLDISYNSLRELISHTNLHRLRRLDASHNQIELTSFVLMYGLRFCDMSFNRLTFLSDMHDLKHLRYLDLSHNFISTGFEALGSLRSLSTLQLAHNCIAFSSLTMVCPVIAATCASPSLLQSHAAIDDLQLQAQLLQVLGSLPKLMALSIAHNPVVSQFPSFTSLLLFYVPNLLIVDGIKVTKLDRQVALAQYRQDVWSPVVCNRKTVRVRVRVRVRVTVTVRVRVSKSE
jgi:Leucine-rich repeat (LRR) protein